MITKSQIIEGFALLPAQTAYKSLMITRTLFREAINRGLIDENPTIGIKPPKLLIKPTRFLKWDELDCIDFGRQNKRIRFLALHGLRYGEAAALTKADIKEGRVIINKSKWGATKTSSGIRSVPLLSEFEEFPKYQNSIAKSLKPHGVTVHSLRKTYAYLLKSTNIHVTTAAKLMGHSNPIITLKIYTQVLDDEIEQSRAILSSFLTKS